MITKTEAQIALNESNCDPLASLTVLSGPDTLGKVCIFFVREWDGEEVNFTDVMFVRKNGKVIVHNG